MAEPDDSDRDRAGPAALCDAAAELVTGAIAVWTVPARSWIAATSLARSLVKIVADCLAREIRSEEHTSELQSLMRISYAVFCLKKKKHSTPIRSLTNPTTTIMSIETPKQ